MLTIEDIIPGEHCNNALTKQMESIVSDPKHKLILEIGSSSGEGSTVSLARGVSKNPGCKLFCVEISKPRFKKLKEKYKANPQVFCYNVCTVLPSDFMTAEQVVTFLRTTKTNKNNFPLDTVLIWREGDATYAEKNQIPYDGINIIKREHKITTFDVVFIDGSGYTAEAELKLTYGAKFFILDDINSIKNYQNYRTLKNSNDYILIEENMKLLNGYAIFEKRG